MTSVFKQLSHFVCDYCNKVFTSKCNLEIHIEDCHVSTSCYCDICDQHFGSPASLELHQFRGHNRYGQPFPECDLCGRIFTRKHNIISHMITVHLKGVGPEIRCSNCNKTFATDRNLRRHMKQMHNPNVEYVTCDGCNKVFKAKHSLIAHIQTAHSSIKDSIKCHLCDKVYTSNRNLKRHVEMLHGEKGEFPCDICPKIYTSNQSRRRHLRTRHYTRDQVYFKCTSCEKVIVGLENMESHVKYFHTKLQDYNTDDIDTDVKTNVCEKCDKTFDMEVLLRQHVKSEHSFKTFYKYCKKALLKQVMNKQCFYKCEYCSNAFNTVYELKDHMRVNHDKEYSVSSCNVCFSKFYSRETMFEHRKICIPPPDVNSCSHCDKLFTDISSLEFHTRIFHPQAQIADSNISSTNMEDGVDTGSYKCAHCNRIYYSDRSLKHHIKLKHTTDEAVECEDCGKMCSNKYYLASHVKLVHNNALVSQCNYCDKEFKSKRNIRRHIEYTHLGMQRHKCIECETLFKEKRSLRKHVRTKHPNSAAFPQCHICHKRFESAKSCKIHLKLLHSFNMNTYPCDLCSISFSSKEALNIHLHTKHLAKDEIYKCEECNVVLKGQERFEQHNEMCHGKLRQSLKEKLLPRCILCMKDFSTRKTLKRHIKKFHEGFDVDELATFGSRRRAFNVECENCIKNFNGEFHHNIYQKLKHLRDSLIFNCETCKSSYNTLEYAIQRYKLANDDKSKTKMVLSELCTTEMSEDEAVSCSGFGSLDQNMKPVSTTIDVKMEPPDEIFSEIEIKTEPLWS